MKKSRIIIAIPRGRILSECQKILNKTPFKPDPKLFDENCRSLTFSSSDPKVFYIKVRSFDVCTFVAFGAAQIGIAGDDVINEFNYSEVYAPLDLKVGSCRISVAAPRILIDEEDPSTWSNVRIATKYPNITQDYYAEKGVQVETIKLNGSMELAPSLKMCRRIVDLVSTGKTLKANGLKEIEKIMDVNSKLIVNRSAYKTKTENIEKIISSIKKVIK